MADPREDKIDFQKLERELEAAVESDAHYWRENDAKMRAVEQRVETYEQFRDMVAAAHIKPLEKEDKKGMLSTRNQPWNPYCSKTAKDGNQKSSTDDQNLKKNTSALPGNSNDFTKHWRKLRDNPLKYKYLIDIGGDGLTKIFHAEISFGLLGDIISVLNQCLEPSNTEAVMHILTCLSKTNRFSLSLGFLGKTEKTRCSELINKLESFITSEDRFDNPINGETQGHTDNDCGIPSEGQINQNSSNSESETNETVQDVPHDKKQHQEVTHQSDDKEIVSKENLESIRRIYKVLPLGR